MHALVTGASGFLGGRAVEMLLARGAQVTVLARTASRLESFPGAQVLRAELCTPIDLPPAAVAGVTHVFHCAGCSTDWAPPAAYRSANVEGVRAMLHLARACMPALQRFVHVSTTDVYGYPKTAGDETAPLLDAGMPYNQSKVAGETLAWEAYAAGLPLTVVRPASIYGPGGKAFVTDIVALLRQRLMLLVDRGRAAGGFVYVDDICEAMFTAADHTRACGQAYNLGNDDGVTWSEYTGALAQVLDLPQPWLQLPFSAANGLARALELPHRLGLPGRPLLTRHAVHLLGRDQGYSIAKARKDLGWGPRTSLEEGVARSVSVRPETP